LHRYTEASAKAIDDAYATDTAAAHNLAAADDNRATTRASTPLSTLPPWLAADRPRFYSLFEDDGAPAVTADRLRTLAVALCHVDFSVVGLDV
jgi:hypothetical protein